MKLQVTQENLAKALNNVARIAKPPIAGYGRPTTNSVVTHPYFYTIRRPPAMQKLARRQAGCGPPALSR